ncbi:MAG: hypothetical protein EP343_30730 [Deltaproteobacteria bacterium]|nr:MAG: hypothetical protein EP343_30730 [Deltaproteobacteria bacterium]
MISLFENISRLEREMSEAHGDFSLFVLFLTPEVHNRWDVVVSAPWLEPGHVGMKSVADKLMASLSKQDLIKVNRIAVIEEDNPIVEEMTQRYNMKHECHHIHPLYLDLAEREFERAVLITAQRDVERHAA